MNGQSAQAAGGATNASSSEKSAIIKRKVDPSRTNQICEISLAMTGSGRGINIGIDLGKLEISKRTK